MLGYPEICTTHAAARRDEWFRLYISTILQRDIRDLSNIEGLTEVPRLLTLLATRAGPPVNFAHIVCDLSIPQTMLKRYLALLEMTFIVQALPAWSSNIGTHPQAFTVLSQVLNVHYNIFAFARCFRRSFRCQTLSANRSTPSKIRPSGNTGFLIPPRHPVISLRSLLSNETKNWSSLSLRWGCRSNRSSSLRKSSYCPKTARSSTRRPCSMSATVIRFLLRRFTILAIHVQTFRLPIVYASVLTHQRHRLISIAWVMDPKLGPWAL